MKSHPTLSLIFDLFSQLGLPTWKAVMEKYGEAYFSVKELNGLLQILGKLTLSAAKDENSQGWFQKEGKNKVVHIHLQNHITKAKDARRQAERPPAELASLPELQTIVLGPSDEPPRTDGPGTTMLTLHHSAKQFALLQSSESLPKLDMVLAGLDLMYMLEDVEEPTPMNEVDAFVAAFKAATTSPSWSIYCFCAYQQHEEVVAVLEKHCNLGVERHFWHKLNTQRNVNQMKSTSAVEVFVVGFFGPAGVSRANHQANFTDAEDAGTSNSFCDDLLSLLVTPHS